MNISERMNEVFKSETKHLVYAPIPATPQRQDHPLPEICLEAENHYIRVWLSEMFLKNDRLLFSTYVPVVHSVIRLQFGGRQAQELPYVAGPQNVGLGSNTLGKGVQLNHALTNLLPYRGGSVAISTALTAYKTKDYFNELVDVLHGVTSLLNVGQLSATLKVVEGAVDGVQNLLGASDKTVHLIYYQDFGGTTETGGVTLKSGYTAIVNADANTFDKDRLFIKNSQLHYGSDLASSKPLTNYDYMLLRIEASTARDDFLSFEEFQKLLNDAIREGLRDSSHGEAIIQTGQIVAWDSPDLTNLDRVRVAKALKQSYSDAINASKDHKEQPLAEEQLKILNNNVRSIHPEEVRRMVGAMTVQTSGGFATTRGRLPLNRFLEAVR